jgi:hypothetical protein
MISVVNLWPNRLIGDADLPPEKQFTATDIDKRRLRSAGGMPAKRLLWRLWPAASPHIRVIRAKVVLSICQMGAMLGVCR